MQSSYLQVGSQQIYYIECNHNKSRPLIFVHGNMSDHTWWKQSIPHFQNYHVVALDLRGYGKSSLNNKTSNSADLAHDVIRFCEIKNFKKVTLIGWSLGGVVCMKIAQLQPQLVDKIILTCSVGHLGYQVSSNQGKKITNYQDLIKATKVTFTETLINTKNQQIMRKIFESLLFIYIKNLSEQRARQLIYSSFQQRNYIDMMYMLAITQIDLSKIKAKWLVILGDKDPVITYPNIGPTIQYLKSNNIKHQISIFQEAGHMIPIQHTFKYVNTIKNFV